MVPKKHSVFSQINDNIILIYQDSMASMNFNTCNSYLIKINDNKYAIIDPGCSIRKLNRTLTQKDIDFSDLQYIFLTHGHSDHVNLVDYIQEKNPKIVTFIHSLEKTYVENAKKYYEMLFPLKLIQKKEKFSDFFTAIKYYTTPNSNLTLNPSFKMIFDTWNIKDRRVDKTFKNGDVLPGNLEVIHTPGHTSGMCMFYRKRDKVLFSSDIHLSPAGATVTGHTGSVQEFKDSINNTIKMIDDGAVKILLTGHGKNPIVDNLRERLQEFYNTITRKEQQLLDILKKKERMTLEEITDESYKKYIKRFKKYGDLKIFQDTIVIAEASELIGNLNFLRELERLNKVKKIVLADKICWKLN